MLRLYQTNLLDVSGGVFLFSIADLIVILVLLFLVVLAIRAIRRKSHCGGCKGCAGPEVSGKEAAPDCEKCRHCKGGERKE